MTAEGSAESLITSYFDRGSGTIVVTSKGERNVIDSTLHMAAENPRFVLEVRHLLRHSAVVPF